MQLDEEQKKLQQIVGGYVALSLLGTQTTRRTMRERVNRALMAAATYTPEAAQETMALIDTEGFLACFRKDIPVKPIKKIKESGS